MILLEKIIARLKQIKSWGSHEYFGKGKQSSYKKKKYVRNAKGSIKTIKKQLDKFEIALNNVNQQYKLDYDSFITSFDDFANIFYDALITDWLVQKKIRNASNALINFRDKADRILIVLKDEIRIAEEYVKSENELKIDLLIQDASKK